MIQQIVITTVSPRVIRQFNEWHRDQSLLTQKAVVRVTGEFLTTTHELDSRFERISHLMHLVWLVSIDAFKGEKSIKMYPNFESILPHLITVDNSDNNAKNSGNTVS